LHHLTGPYPETIHFEYDSAWLDDADRFSLAPALALTLGIFAPSYGLVTFGSLGDSAPDTWGRRRDARNENARRARIVKPIGKKRRTRSG